MRTEDEDYSVLLGDSPAERLKGLLADRAKALTAIDKAAAALVEAVKSEGAIRGQVLGVLELAGKHTRDARRDWLSGQDVAQRVKVMVSPAVGNDIRHDKSVPAPRCAALADCHDEIQKLI